MANIETLIVPYSNERDGLVTRTGSSTSSSPGEREMFDHLNMWIPGPAMQDTNGDFTATQNFQFYPCRVFPRDSEHTVTYSIRRPRKWDDGNVTYRIWYGGEFTDAAEVAYCKVLINLISSSANSFESSYSEMVLSLMIPDTDINPIINRDAEVDTTDAGYVTISSQYDFVCIRFGRYGDNVSDTYDEELRLYGIEMFYRPRLVESTGLPPWLMVE